MSLLCYGCRARGQVVSLIAASDCIALVTSKAFLLFYDYRISFPPGMDKFYNKFLSPISPPYPELVAIVAVMLHILVLKNKLTPITFSRSCIFYLYQTDTGLGCL